ncbi:hypothetical protein HPB52_006719 [Rhipicephalus sanguineus]|uniref:Uncharacterized protein n=1 Tax=Rhipicephalus sanguineus TaxID=34632 RepID=A0A9D4SQD2_RHISA|nr:hypothetical protein HPB52_006719 [Rhipicephalus sanguineus]
MGDVFCLVMLESGSRRKLKLQTGAYEELLAGLSGIDEFDSRNTLIQIFDADLEDFVDLMPGDVVPHKAKVRVVRKNNPAPSSVAASPVKASSSTSHPSQQFVHQIAPRSPASPEKVFHISRQGDQLHYSIQSSDVSVAPTICTLGDVLTQAPYVNIKKSSNSDAEALESMITSVEDVPDAPAAHSQEMKPLIAPAQSNKTAEPGDAVMRLSRVTEDLRAMLPDHLVTDDVKQLVPNSAIIPKHEHDRNDYLKFELPSSFGVWCDIALERKTLITPKLRRHIITVLFQACYKISLYPTMRLYRRAIDALMVKYPHIAEGPFNWQCWCLALRSKFKNTRRKLRRRPVSWALGVDEPLESSMSADSHGQSGGDASVGMEAMAFKVEPDQQSSEAMSDCSNFNSAELEDVTVSDLLSTCTDEAATEKLVDQAGGRALADGNTNGGELSLEGRPSLKDRDDMKFELPSFGVFEDALEMRQPVTNRLRRHITRCLFDCLLQDNPYPTSHLYRTAVDLLLHKYPHLIDTTGETGRELWVDSLKSKFKNVRRRLPEQVWSMSKVRSKYTTSPRRATAPPKPKEEGVGRASRPVAIQGVMSASTSSSWQTGPLGLGGMEGASDQNEAVAVKERSDSIRDMTVQQAIAAFPAYRQESALLADFKMLWNADIPECFEKGIKRMFLVLMNSGTKDEMEKISQAGNDILLMVLGAIARRVSESLDSLLTEGSTLPTPCLVQRPNGNIDLFVNGFYLLTASSLLGGMCVLFASFWVFHIEYPKGGRNILTFLEHAFLNLRHMKPRLKCWELINLYRSTHP